MDRRIDGSEERKPRPEAHTFQTPALSRTRMHPIAPSWLFSYESKIPEGAGGFNPLKIRGIARPSGPDHSRGSSYSDSFRDSWLEAEIRL
jgi:hypothetical protein